MRKVISHCLFRLPETPQWLFNFYLRGLVWNCKMNAILYAPLGFTTHIEVDSRTFSDYDNIFHGLRDIYEATLTINEAMPICRAMLTRLKPVFNEDVEVVLCRDSDSITTYKEAAAVHTWLSTMNAPIMTLRDNVAHSMSLMGGLSNFRAKPIRDEYGTWEGLLDSMKSPLDKHGSDQVGLVKTIGEKFRNSIQIIDLYGIKWDEVENVKGVDAKYKTSSLIPAFAGAAGVNAMEYLRWEREHLSNPAFEGIEKSYKDIFYQWL